ncbi:hypothetical protein B0H13DRAFT_2421861 [Mycena leptocephala]|nr:hypothetical protein B0H13DRAFT_2421861 [Mycena leptocephala]
MVSVMGSILRAILRSARARRDDVIHPAPGSDRRPSFTALIANVDSDTAKYIAASRVQNSRQEMIEELESMSHRCLSMYMRYREMAEKKAAGTSAPKRIIFYCSQFSCIDFVWLSESVSAGQFKQVLEQELPLIKSLLPSAPFPAYHSFYLQRLPPKDGN